MQQSGIPDPGNAKPADVNLLCVGGVGRRSPSDGQIVDGHRCVYQVEMQRGIGDVQTRWQRVQGRGNFLPDHNAGDAIRRYQQKNQRTRSNCPSLHTINKRMAGDSGCLCGFLPRLHIFLHLRLQCAAQRHDGQPQMVPDKTQLMHRAFHAGGIIFGKKQFITGY